MHSLSSLILSLICCVYIHPHTHTQGKIVPARGPTNFGWDPIFEADGYGQTFAELDKKIKNEISHRAKALSNMKEYFHNLKQHSTDKEQQKPNKT